MKAMTCILALVLGGGAYAQEATAPKDTIDIVFCIDCSGSMGGVIETAKQKVWAIVNEIAKDRPKAALRIGLMGYGNADRSYRMFPLSEDLDEVYKNLVTFKDEGWGDEWVGLAVHKARNEMKWTAGKNVLKMMFIVGNETARQGPAEYDYSKTAPEAIKSGIMVNAIYCGNTDYARATPTWREMASLADGSYQEIGAQGGAVSIATPFDKELAELSAKLNQTYVAYGRRGADGKRKQEEQDRNAQQAGPSAAPAAPAAERALAKSAGVYNNRAWDLVDASKEKDFSLEKIEKEQLPAEMQTMTLEERKAYVEKKAQEREEIQKQIREISVKRDGFIKEEMKKQGLSEDKALHAAVRQVVSEKADKMGTGFGR